MQTDLTYPVTYQRETSPSWLNYAAALGGGAPRAAQRPFRYLELGCGRGYSALLHAAGHPQGEFHAVDRDAAAIAQARAWAAQAGVGNARFHAAAFDEAQLRALPRFDFIVLHGVYSWVDAQTRALLRGLLRDLLLPGGLAYVSYNCLPGWAGEMPLRRLLGELSGGREHVVAAARVVEDLRLAGLTYFTAHPAADRAVASWRERPAGYLAHEYLAPAWDPMWSVDVMAEMAQAGLAFAGSATLVDQHEALLVDDAAAQAIGALATPRLRTLAQDFAVNRGFRRDVFVAGTPGTGSLDGIRIGGDPGALSDAVLVPRGRITFQPAFVAALRALLAQGPLGLGDAVAALSTAHNAAEVARNLLWLVAAGALAPVVPCPAAEGEVRAALERLGVTPLA